MQRPPQEDFSAHLDGRKVTGDVLTRTYDLVEQVQYLYVRVVQAKDLPGKDLDPYVEVRLGNYSGTTRHFVKKTNPEWNQVFAFSMDRIQVSVLEVNVKDKDDSVGRVMFDLNEIPKRVPWDSPLAPQWYRLEDGSESWHSDAATVSGADALVNIRSKVYHSPKLWYLRVNVIEAQDLIPGDRSRFPEVYVKAILGNQELITKVSRSKTINPIWNEDLIFVAAEPFEEPLILSVEDRVAPNKDVILGKCLIHLQYIERRLDHRPMNSKWYNLEKHVIVEGEKEEEINFASRIHMSLYLEGGYHVLDESTNSSGDLRPTAKQLQKSSIGILELGILNARGLLPMKTKDGRASTDAYCVAKYGHKWVQTRTIIDSLAPKWNEQYTWEVFDPCTVITIGVFDNCHLHGGDKPGGQARDSRIGKVRIRLSALETDRVYSHSYPLLVFQSTGVKKIGEIHLAVRFTFSSLMNMMHLFSQPLLPKMHYIHPLIVEGSWNDKQTKMDNLRRQASQMVSMSLSRAEPPLRKEIVEYMLDVKSDMWSMRKIRANFLRIMDVLGGLIAIRKWFDQICNWKNPIATLVIHVLYLILVLYPKCILPTIFLSLTLIVVWNYRYRHRHPPFIDIRLSCADDAHPDELDEEFDTFPTSRPTDIVRIRYDRLKSIVGSIQNVAGDIANQLERLDSLPVMERPYSDQTVCYFLLDCCHCSLFHGFSSCDSCHWILCVKTSMVPSEPTICSTQFLHKIACQNRLYAMSSTCYLLSIVVILGITKNNACISLVY
ncbi:hypothetical protein MTR67_050088 [Solanum verrucosum]|uniref:C2 domain-containing protein n=1 Tax=Solanum verrucosum TaxID=315347 RepID=A0AAF1A0X0_SOLVR|nr:hypothetical protein MTR67_050088 [Solanum verrucosum]